jgi:hypothetical protein
VALLGLLRPLGSPIGGEHRGRQAMVQANIEKILDGESWLRPGTYDLQAGSLLYEFPLYQWVVSGISYGLHVNSLVVARLVNIALFLISLYLLDALLAFARQGALQRVLTLSLVASSPLQIHFYSVPLSDGLALTGSLAALCAYVRLESPASRRARRLWFAIMLAGGFVAALIKCTVLLPICAAVLAHSAARHGWRCLRGRRELVLAVACLLGLTTYVWIRNSANHGIPIVNQNPHWMFGSLADRLDTEKWAHLKRSFWELVLATPMILLTVVGLVIAVRGERAEEHPSHWLFLGWALGSVAYVLVFLNLHWQHSYYQLPIIYPAAFYAGLALTRSFALLNRKASLRRTSLLVVALALGASLFTSSSTRVRILRRSYSPTPTENGAWLEEHTHPRDFVIYVTEADIASDPYLLYGPQRTGHLLGIKYVEEYGPSILGMIVDVYVEPSREHPFENIHVYGPPDVADRLERVLGHFEVLHERTSKKHGRLYTLERPGSVNTNPTLPAG